MSLQNANTDGDGNGGGGDRLFYSRIYFQSRD